MAKKLLDPGFLAGMQPKSFRDALSGDSIVSFPNFRISSHRGMPSLWFSEEEFLHLAKPFEFALVGRFPLKRPTLDSIRKFFFGLKLSGDFSVTLLDQTNVLIKLHNDLDYARVFAHRSYLVFGCFMKVIKWSPVLDLSEESPVVPVWLSFPGLRPHLFSSRILFGLGSIFGRPIQTDNATAAGSRPSVARILVELDVTKPYPNSVWLGPEKLGYVQKVVFECMPVFCSSCKTLGHKKMDCPNRNSKPPTAEPIAANFLKEPITSVDPVLSRECNVLGNADDASLARDAIDCEIPIISNMDGAEQVALPVIDGRFAPIDQAGVSIITGGINETEVVVGLDVDTVIGGVGGMENEVSCALSPYAPPFVPPVLLPNCVEAVNVAASVGVSPVVIAPELNLPVDPKCNEVINSFVDVPVNVVDSHFAGNFLGDASGSNVRNNLNWLESSEGELVSDSDDEFMPSPEFCGGSDPGSDFNLVNVRPVSVVGFRGRARGRGRGHRRR
ncbi:hypothetical protein KFK09_024718 [Dendrobium nobile]|uniref:DUF4283 domain-containing protein n=1 Tax=Dendrobium nobile TaxID=94219 RepID=A0A8T3ADW3_DENNO|nr:hypothetical protein KFK09_024718 [Dendrobium nobile]